MKKLIIVLAIILLSLIRVDSSFAYVKGNVKALYGSGLIAGGPVRILSVSMFAPASGDAVMIYNGINGNSTGIEFELSISANTMTDSIHFGDEGAFFKKGIYIHATDSDVLTNVVFDY